MIRRVRDFLEHRHDWTWHSGMEPADDTSMTYRRVEPEHNVCESCGLVLEGPADPRELALLELPRALWSHWRGSRLRYRLGCWRHNLAHRHEWKLEETEYPGVRRPGLTNERPPQRWTCTRCRAAVPAEPRRPARWSIFRDS